MKTDQTILEARETILSQFAKYRATVEAAEADFRRGCYGAVKAAFPFKHRLRTNLRRFFRENNIN